MSWISRCPHDTDRKEAFLPTTRKSPTSIAAHRGGAGLWPENSMTAFRNAARLPVEAVEFDVHPTRDGQLVVHHDPTLERMTDGFGSIVDATFDELAHHTIKGTEADRIPLFSEVLNLFRPSPLIVRVEIKGNADKVPYPDLESDVARILSESGMSDRAVITSFFVGILDRFHNVAADTPMIWLVNRLVYRHTGGIEPILDIAVRHGLAEIALHATDLGPTAMESAQATGIRMGAYGVNDEATIRRMLDLKVATFTTNFPDIALNLRATQ